MRRARAVITALALAGALLGLAACQARPVPWLVPASTDTPRPHR